MAFTDPEIQEIKNLLGYGNLTVGARPYFDVAAIFQVIVQQNCDAFGENYVRVTILPAVRGVEALLAPSVIASHFIASEIAEAKLDPKEKDRLTNLRDWWIGRLSETLQIKRVPRNSSSADLEIG
jgi:hypothetical protein